MGITSPPRLARNLKPPTREAKRQMPEENKAANEQPPEILYHYTTQEAFLSITDNRQLWATDMRYLNDWSEIEIGAALAEEFVDGFFDRVQEEKIFDGLIAGVGELLKQKREDLARIVYAMEDIEVFVFSLSEEGDQASQWRAYAGTTGGVSLGFNKALLEALAKDQGLAMRRCVYEEARQRELIQQTIPEMPLILPEEKLKRFFFELAKLLPVLKDGCFSEEKEWRLVSDFTLDVRERLGFRAGRGTIVPYQPIAFSDEPTALAQVTIGPTSEEELAESAVKSLLHRRGFAHCRVVTSEVPLRF